jgi:hypothetical protein
MMHFIRSFRACVLGVRRCPGALATRRPGESGAAAPHSKTLSRATMVILFLLTTSVIICAAEPEGSTMKLSIPGGLPRNPPIKNDHIWSGVIVATNPEHPKEPPTELREYAPRLKHMFGYTQFELAGSATEEIDELTENWLVPSPIFPLSVKARRATSKEARGGYLLNLQVFQEKRQVLDAEVKLAPGSPLFIRGPQYGKGQIIIVLQVQR